MSRKASLAAWGGQPRLLIVLIAASLCLAVIFGVKSGSQSLQAQELRVCQNAVIVKVNPGSSA